MRSRFTIKAHVVDRYLERVEGRLGDNIRNISGREIDQIKLIIRDEIARSRKISPEEKVVLGKRIDTEVYLYDNHAYFFRAGKDLCVSMMVLDPAMMATMAHLVESSGYALELPPSTPRNTADRKPSDARSVHHDATIEIPTHIASFLQTGQGWFHRQQQTELYRLLAWPWSRIPHASLRKIIPDIDLKDYHQYYFHAAADLLVGVMRRSRREGSAKKLVMVDTVEFVLPLAKDSCFKLSLRFPRALWGSHATELRCEPEVLARIYNVRGGRLVDALRFMLDQFHDPDTRFADPEEEPDVHVDMEEGVECYHAPDCFLFFDGNYIVDVVLKEEKSLFDGEPPKISTEEIEQPAEPIVHTMTIPKTVDSDNVIELGDRIEEPADFLVMQTLLKLSPKTITKVRHHYTVSALQDIRRMLKLSMGRLDSSVLSGMQQISYDRLIEELNLLDVDVHPSRYGEFFASPEFAIQVLHGSRIEDIFFIPEHAFVEEAAQVVNAPARAVPEDKPPLTNAVVIDTAPLIPRSVITASREADTLRIKSDVLNKYYKKFPKTKNRAAVMKHIRASIGKELTLEVLDAAPIINHDALSSILPRAQAKEVVEYLRYRVFPEFVLAESGLHIRIISNIFFISKRRTFHHTSRP